MANLVKVNQALGHEWTIIAGDQATYELATAIRQKEATFDKVILLLGVFHLAANYLRAIFKIIQDAGGEKLLTKAGLFTEATSRKVFGKKADYYQTLHAVNILSEALRSLYVDAFEGWLQESGKSLLKDGIEDVLKQLITNTVNPDNLNDILETLQPNLKGLKCLMITFEDTLKAKPCAVFWLTFLKMADNLQRFILYEREGNWTGYLSEAAKMLPFLTAAGHHKYGQQSLPLYLKEMKELPSKAPIVHAAMMAGGFVGRRTEGSHNSVSPDMLLEQTYNADAKEESGLDGITLNEAARTKWVYTKPITAAISAQVKEMLHVTPGTERHHDSGETKVNRHKNLVANVKEAVETNPFKASLTYLMNISTGVIANENVQHHLTNVEAIGYEALKKTLGKGPVQGKKIVKLNTFHTQDLKSRSSTSKPPEKSTEVTALLRMTQIIACGGEVDVVKVIGEHECSEFPPSLFTKDGQMRNPGTKSTLVKTLLKESGTAVAQELTNDAQRTAVVVDAMHLIRKWSFQKGQSYEAVPNRYMANLLTDVPNGTTSIHFWCDQYKEISLKECERQHRARSRSRSKALRTYEVMDGFTTPDPADFFAISRNKANLQNYLCQKWCSEPMEGDIVLYLAGGFSDETKTVKVTGKDVQLVPSLMSTHEEADQRVLLHALFSAAQEDVARTSRNMTNFWIRTNENKYLPVHEMANGIGPDLCQLLPFIHSISGRDTTSFLYGIGKGSWIAQSKELNMPALASLGENEAREDVTPIMLDEATQLLKAVYGGKGVDQDLSIAEMRTQKFLNSRSSLLRIIPPTGPSFEQHVYRAAYATLVDKSAHIQQPDLPPFTRYGWKLEEGVALPVTTTHPQWPDKMDMKMGCQCVKGCKVNCSCRKRGIACYIACKCTGSIEKCSHARIMAALHDASDDNN
jgi:hypothetical protein